MKIKNKGNIRDLFIGLNEKVCDGNGECIDGINFDNAATTPTFKSNINVLKDMSKIYASIGRGAGQKAEISTNLYNEARNFLINYFNIKNKDDYTVVLVKNTTEGINRLSKILPQNNDDEIIISSRMEHHSNDLPWRNKCDLKYVEVNEDGRININEIKELIERY